MGNNVSSTTYKSLCDSNNHQPFTQVNGNVQPNTQALDAPPAFNRPLNFEERLYEKFRKQPLVPIGCAATAYFLISGLYSFRNRDPRRSQKMMRARVGAQFATLLAFIGYVGPESVNFEIAPAYNRAKEAEEDYNRKMQQQQARGGSSE